MASLSFSFLCNRPRQGLSGFVGISTALFLGTSAAIGGLAPAEAAQQIVVTYGPVREDFSVNELTTFAETGEPSRTLRAYLNLANVEPEVFRAILTDEIGLRLKFVDSALNSLPGEFVLFQVGQLVHTGSRQANIQALRSAFVLSVSEDNRVSLLEFLQNYPTPQLYIDGVQVARVARDVGNVVEDVKTRLEAIVAAVEEVLPGLICDCNRQTATGTPSTPDTAQ